MSECAYDITQIQVRRAAGIGFLQKRTHDSILLHSQAGSSVMRPADNRQESPMTPKNCIGVFQQVA
jgi:hypothetical protein